MELYWIPLGAGQRVVRVSGKVFEALSALVQRRRTYDLYHSALAVIVPEGRFVIEMAPIPDSHGERRGVVAEGPVGTKWAGGFRRFRYEIRRWWEGDIPDAEEAISTVSVDVDVACARRLLDLVPSVPMHVWGRDELGAGEMWNSNSVTSWLLRSAGVDTGQVEPPCGGRAPGWDAGLVAAADRETSAVGLAAASDTGTTAKTATRTRRVLVAEMCDVLHDIPAFLAAPLFRKWHRHWGATQGEIAEAFPGDELLPHAQFRATRAIAIHAPPEAVWPWLVQVGCLRAGWYSNDLLDNLGHPSATTIVPGFQHLEIGQWVPMSPSPTPSDRTALKVHSFELNRWLLWSKPESTWVWRLTPTADSGTRLVTRIRAVYDWRHPLTALLGVVLMEFGDFAMQRRMLRGIKARAESPDPRAEPAAQRQLPHSDQTFRQRRITSVGHAIPPRMAIASPTRGRRIRIPSSRGRTGVVR